MAALNGAGVEPCNHHQLVRKVDLDLCQGCESQPILQSTLTILRSQLDPLLDPRALGLYDLCDTPPDARHPLQFIDSIPSGDFTQTRRENRCRGVEVAEQGSPFWGSSSFG